MNRRVMSRVMAPMIRRMRLLLTRAVVRIVDPVALMQRLQVEALAGEVLDGVEHFEAYGLTSRAQAGSEAIVASLGGTRSHAVAIVVSDRRYRVKNLAAGEVCLYTDEDIGGPHRIHFKRNREIHLIAGVSSIVIKPSGIILTAPAIDMVKV